MGILQSLRSRKHRQPQPALAHVPLAPPDRTDIRACKLPEPPRPKGNGPQRIPREFFFADVSPGDVIVLDVDHQYDGSSPADLIRSKWGDFRFELDSNRRLLVTSGPGMGRRINPVYLWTDCEALPHRESIDFGRAKGRLVRNQWLHVELGPSCGWIGSYHRSRERVRQVYVNGEPRLK